MKFSKAVKKLYEGERIKRLSWNDGWLEIVDEDICFTTNNLNIYVETYFNQEEFEAEDWIVLE